MKPNIPFLFFLACLGFCRSGYAQNDSVTSNKSERKVVINPNPFLDSTQISIAGNYHLKTLKITICSRNGQAVMEFIPGQIPFMLKKGDLAAGRYFVRCIDKYGRIPSKKMTIKKEGPESGED